MMKTREGANAHEHSLDHVVEFFSKAGSLMKGSKKVSFYPSEEGALSLFQKSWIVDPLLTLKVVLQIRDCRGGSGNRSAAKECYEWLAKNDPEWLAANIGWLPLVGRWDDLKVLFGTDLEKHAVELWSAALKEKDVLAAKWADRSDRPLRLAMEMKIGDFRRLLAAIRAKHLVETKMCQKEWEAINYEHVPSVAMARYTKAFGKNDAERFEAYKAALSEGKAKINAKVLFPHDCIKTVVAGDEAIADAQFEALPNYLEGTNGRPLVICDTSGSMCAPITDGSMVQRVWVSQGLALYCSAKMPKEGPFYKKFVGFSSESKFADWNRMKFSQAIHDRNVFDHAVGSTRIDLALKLILKTAEFFKVTNDHMPTMLLIVSDMQFHQGTEESTSYYLPRRKGEKLEKLEKRASNETEVERCMKLWNDAGYKTPKIVYWNLAGYAGAQATVRMPNTALVSGFSPAILKAILTAQDFTPRGIMMEALKKYDIVAP